MYWIVKGAADVSHLEKPRNASAGFGFCNGSKCRWDPVTLFAQFDHVVLISCGLRPRTKAEHAHRWQCVSSGRAYIRNRREKHKPGRSTASASATSAQWTSAT